MSILFNASEIIQFAIRIEKNGEDFYRQMAKKIRAENIKDVFNYLADEEIRHRQIFQDMVSQVETYQPQESYPNEYFSYLRAYANEHIFNKEKTGQLMARQIKTAKEAVRFAIEIEVDSILYYLEAKNLVPQGQREIIDKVIEEERRHYLKLLELKNNC